MPYYCTVPRCTSMAGKVKNVSFHQFPRDEELGKLWNEILKRGKPYTKYSKVCSLHFKPEDYTITSVGKNKGQWRTLRKDAVPSRNLPSDDPSHQQQRQSEPWLPNMSPVLNVMDPMIQQHVAQAIYMQTMLAMQAVGAANSFNIDTESDESHEEPVTETPPPAQQTHKQANSYKCNHCTKCFKDPDVFLLHQRNHKTLDGYEKENVNLNTTLTVQANPILVNLLRSKEKHIEKVIPSGQINLFNELDTKMDQYLRLAVLSNDTAYDGAVNDTHYNSNTNNVVKNNVNKEQNVKDNVISDLRKDTGSINVDHLSKNDMNDRVIERLNDRIISDYLRNDSVNRLESRDVKTTVSAGGDSDMCDDTLIHHKDGSEFDEVNVAMHGVDENAEVDKVMRDHHKDDCEFGKVDMVTNGVCTSDDTELSHKDDSNYDQFDNSVPHRSDRLIHYADNSERYVTASSDGDEHDNRLIHDGDSVTVFHDFTNENLDNNLNDRVNERIQRLSMLVNTNYSLISNDADRANIIFGNKKIIEGVIDFKLNDRVVNHNDRLVSLSDRDISEREINLNESIESNNLIIDESA